MGFQHTAHTRRGIDSLPPPTSFDEIKNIERRWIDVQNKHPEQIYCIKDTRAQDKTHTPPRRLHRSRWIKINFVSLGT